MGKMIFTLVAMSALVGVAKTANAEAPKTKPTKHVHSAKEQTCEKCKNAKKACVCEEDEKHGDHDHEEGNHDNKDEKKAK